MSDNEAFDTDIFIEEIRNLPCLWDQRTEEYSNRIIKNKTWETISKKFYEDFENKTIKEKNQCATNLQRKWRSLRDSFNRDLKKQNSQKSGSGAGSSKRYYYYSQLLFLMPLSEKRKTTSSVSEQNNDDDIELINNEKENTTGTSDSEVWKRPKNIQKKKDDVEFGLIKKLTSHLTNHVTARRYEPDKSCDSDMHFLLSQEE